MAWYPVLTSTTSFAKMKIKCTEYSELCTQLPRTPITLTVVGCKEFGHKSRIWSAFKCYRRELLHIQYSTHPFYLMMLLVLWWIRHDQRLWLQFQIYKMTIVKVSNENAYFWEIRFVIKEKPLIRQKMSAIVWLLQKGWPARFEASIILYKIMGIKFSSTQGKETRENKNLNNKNDVLENTFVSWAYEWSLLPWWCLAPIATFCFMTKTGPHQQSIQD